MTTANKDKWLLLAAGAILIALLGGIYMFNLYQSKTLYFLPDPQCSPCNPARGFYVQVNSDSPERLEKLQGEATLCLLSYDLYDFRDRDLTDEKLQELRNFLEAAKTAKIQCIFRAAYGFQEQDSNDADSWEQIQTHVGQIAPILNQYVPQIYCVQAGFFGPWGEWHHSRYLETGEYRNKLITLLLESLDPAITVDLRRPRFIREYGSYNRLGYHDDGLLSTHSDYGTYDDPDFDREQELRWMKKHISAVQNGGEMPLVSEFTQPQNARKEFRQLKLSYLNSRYNREVLEDWAGKTLEGVNALQYFRDHLGYRYYISRLRFPEEIRSGPFSLGQKVVVTIENEGFAPIDPRYHWELVLRNGGEPQVIASFQPEARNPRAMSFGIAPRFLRRAGDCQLGLRLVSNLDPENPDWVSLVNFDQEPMDGIHYFLSVRDGRIQSLLNR